MMRRLGLATLACAAMWVGMPATGSAQDAQVRVRQECRCVDRDGNEIENCTCIRAPDVSVMAPRLGFFTGFERRAQIGVWIDYDQDEDVDREGGVLLTEVQEDGPAGEAGLREGDIIVRVNGRSFLDPLPEAEDEEELDLDQSIPVQRFVRIVGQLEPGEAVEFEIIRDDRRQTVTVTPEEPETTLFIGGGDAPVVAFGGDALRLDLERLRDEEHDLREYLEALREREGDLRARGERDWNFELRGAPQVLRFHADSVRGTTRWDVFGGDPCFSMDTHEREGAYIFSTMGNCVDGVEFLEMNDDLAEYFEAADGGVLVTEVSDESTLGLRAGDVLIAIDGRDVRDVGHVRRVLSSYDEGEEIRLRVIRRGSEMEVLGRRRDG